jgi:hypothetical protein
MAEMGIASTRSSDRTDKAMFLAMIAVMVVTQWSCWGEVCGAYLGKERDSA